MSIDAKVNKVNRAIEKVNEQSNQYFQLMDRIDILSVLHFQFDFDSPLDEEKKDQVMNIDYTGICPFDFEFIGDETVDITLQDPNELYLALSLYGSYKRDGSIEDQENCIKKEISQSAMEGVEDFGIGELLFKDGRLSLLNINEVEKLIQNEDFGEEDLDEIEKNLDDISHLLEDKLDSYSDVHIIIDETFQIKGKLQTLNDEWLS